MLMIRKIQILRDFHWDKRFQCLDTLLLIFSTTQLSYQCGRNTNEFWFSLEETGAQWPSLAHDQWAPQVELVQRSFFPSVRFPRSYTAEENFGTIGFGVAPDIVGCH